MVLPSEIGRNKRILSVCLVFVVIVIFSFMRVRIYGTENEPEKQKIGQVQSTVTPVSSELGQVKGQTTSPPSLNSPTPSQKVDVQSQPKSQSQTSNPSNDASLNLTDFERLSYQPTNLTKEEFFAREKKLLGNIGSVRFERIVAIQDKDKMISRDIYTYKIKNEKVRIEISGSIIISRADGCFRQKVGSDIFYKYKNGQPEENCRTYGRWNRYTLEEFEAISDFKILGEGSFGGKPATVAQAPISVSNTQFIMKGWFSNENGLALLAGGVAGDKKVMVEFKNFDFSNIDDAVFEIPQGKVIESSELF